jgi:hypothetical protein
LCKKLSSVIIRVTFGWLFEADTIINGFARRESRLSTALHGGGPAA